MELRARRSRRRAFGASTATSSSTIRPSRLPPRIPRRSTGGRTRLTTRSPTALMVNFQSVEFRARAERRGAPRGHRLDAGAQSILSIDNRIGLTGGRCKGAPRRWRSRFPHRNGIGSVLRSSVLAVRRAAASRGCCCPRRATLSALSCSFGASPGEPSTESCGWRPHRPTATPFFSFDSLTLAEVVRLTNKFSNNLMARHLLLTLGAERFGGPATVDKGVQRDIGLVRGARAASRRHGDRQWVGPLAQRPHLGRFSWRPFCAPPIAAGMRRNSSPRCRSPGIDGTLRSRMQGADPGSVRLKTGPSRRSERAWRATSPAFREKFMSWYRS